MALGANAVALLGRQRRRVDNVLALSTNCMRRSWPVPAFAADSGFDEYPRLRTVLRAWDRLHAGCMTLQASGRNGARQKRITVTVIAWRWGPRARTAVVSGGRFIQKVTHRHQVASRRRPRTYEVSKFAALFVSKLAALFVSKLATLFAE